MGEVIRPEKFMQRRGTPSPDLSPRPSPPQIPPTTLEEVLRQLEYLKAEVAKIKLVLKAQGIIIE
ncbi:MAG: hypothetical protein V1915_02375 [Candidatus Bathyarchaeota archaeon]